jgi:hypothetical protein
MANEVAATIVTSVTSTPVLKVSDDRVATIARTQSSDGEAPDACAFAFLDLVRSCSDEPEGCSFLGYARIAGQPSALYRHNCNDAVAAFGYDARTRKLVYVCALNN